MKQNNQDKIKLVCIKCHKIICEAKNDKQMKEILNEKKYVMCPYCGWHYANPYNSHQ